MSTRRLSIATISAAIIMVASGCSAPLPPQPSLESALHGMDDQGELVIGELVPEGVDELVLACPYSTPESLAEETGLSTADFEASTTKLPRDDNSFALLAISGPAIRHLGSYPRTEVDLCGGDRTWGALLGTSDTLELESSDGGKTWVPASERG